MDNIGREEGADHRGNPVIRPLYDSLFRNLAEYSSDISVDADTLGLDFFRAVCLLVVDAGIECIVVSNCFLPEGIFDDDWRVAAHTELQVDDVLALVEVQELRVCR